jgi:hypothetical protein
MCVITEINGRVVSHPFTAKKQTQIWQSIAPKWQTDYLAMKA